jgi:hypothetical protein
VREPYVVIVGICAAGKSTLAAGLCGLGINAKSVPQEHSYVRRLWEKLHPGANILIMLDASFETTKRRRPTITYGPERLDDQRLRLQNARELCDLYLPTDDLSIEEVRQAAAAWVAHWKGMSDDPRA